MWVCPKCGQVFDQKDQPHYCGRSRSRREKNFGGMGSLAVSLGQLTAKFFRRLFKKD